MVGQGDGTEGGAYGVAEAPGDAEGIGSDVVICEYSAKTYELPALSVNGDACPIKVNVSLDVPGTPTFNSHPSAGCAMLKIATPSCS